MWTSVVPQQEIKEYECQLRNNKSEKSVIIEHLDKTKTLLIERDKILTKILQSGNIKFRKIKIILTQKRIWNY